MTAAKTSLPCILRGVSVSAAAVERGPSIADRFGLLVTSGGRVFRTFGHRLVVIQQGELAQIARASFRDDELPAAAGVAAGDRAIASKRVVVFVRAVLWRGIWGESA